MRTRKMETNREDTAWSDKLISYVGIFASIMAVAFFTIYTGRLIFELIGILTLAFFVLWLFLRTTANHSFDLNIWSSRYMGVALFFLYALSLLLSIVVINLREDVYSRPMEYFVLIPISVGAIFAAIMTGSMTKRRILILITAIIFVGLDLDYSQQALFPNVIGIDTWWHQWFAGNIIASGRIPSGTDYSGLPFFHLEISSASIVTGVDYKLASMFSIGFVYVVMTVLVAFLLGRTLFDNRIGLIASMMTVIANYVVGKGLAPIPTTLGFLFLVTALLLRLESDGRRKSSRDVLVLVMCGSVIMTHTLASLAMALALLVGSASIWFFSRTYKPQTENCFPRRFAILFLVWMIAYWALISGSLAALYSLVRSGFSLEYFVRTPSIVTEYGTSIPIEEQLMNNLGMLLFFSTSILGFLYMISRKLMDSRSFAFAMIGIFPLIISFATISTGHSIIEERWWSLAQLLLCLPFGLSIALIVSRIGRRRISFLGIMAYVVFLAFLMIVSPQANLDNQHFSPNSSVRFGFKVSEIEAAGFVAQNYDGLISSDFDFGTNPSSSIFLNYYAISKDRIVSMDNSLLKGEFHRDGVLKVVREEICTHPFRVFGGVYKLTYNPNDLMYSAMFDRVFDSQSVTILT